MATPEQSHPAVRPAQQNPTHSYLTRYGNSGSAEPSLPKAFSPSSLNAGVMNAQSVFNLPHPFPTDQPPKKVAFELLLDEDTKTRARIPLRVLINTHNTTESIITTVKNFYGIYDNKGVEFQDARGNSLIANYYNMVNDMTVYVRVVAQPSYPNSGYTSPRYKNLQPDEYYVNTVQDPPHIAPPMPSQILEYGEAPSRPASVQDHNRSNSPQHGRARRSASTQKPGSRADPVSRTSSIHGNNLEDVVGGYSDSDGGDTSVTSSKKARSEQYVSADISLENIVQDGRRKRPKFESSELPLFVPPQVPLVASSSSISPQRRSTGQEGPSPFQRPTQRTFAYPAHPLYSPQSYGTHDLGQVSQAHYNVNQSTPVAPHGHRLRERPNVQPFARSSSSRGGNVGSGILPTPDPTIASCISDEDVARQLIALGDASNFSSHGRTSASTLDDALSGAADVASSTGATSDSDETDDEEDPVIPPLNHAQTLTSAPKFKREGSFYESDDVDDAYHNDEQEVVAKSEADEYDGLPKAKRVKTKSSSANNPKSKPSKTSSNKASKTAKGRQAGSAKKHKTATAGQMKAPPLPNGVPQPRKNSSSSTLNFQHQLAADEEDLSSKPRCQRCRKSKKGCDRQRPCGRCKDAGIGIDGCISEDESNGRKGRFGRHMGVSVKKGSEEGSENSFDMQPAPGLSSSTAGPDTKKRKR
ncbi:MAG: hypothetical protein Q9227_002731 [Pyrenula ochraceoflavens]